jgi:hypothetical protein
MTPIYPIAYLSGFIGGDSIWIGGMIKRPVIAPGCQLSSFFSGRGHNV